MPDRTLLPRRISTSVPVSIALSLAAALTLVAGSAHATVTLVDQTRSVSTFTTVDFHEGQDSFTQDRFQSQEPGQFQEVADCHAGIPGDQATAVANQLSYVEPQSLLAEGNFQAHAEISEMADFAEGFGEARYSSTFSVDEPTEVRLRATLNATGNGRVNLIFRVRDGEIFVYRALSDGTDSIDNTRVLTPGTYQLEAQTSGFGQALPNGQDEAAFGSFGLSLVFASPADVASGAPETSARVAPVVAPNPILGQARILLASDGGKTGRSGQTVMVLDPSGRVVRRFGDVGSSGVVWDTRDDAGRRVSAGMYLVRSAGGGSTRVAVLR